MARRFRGGPQRAGDTPEVRADPPARAGCCRRAVVADRRRSRANPVPRKQSAWAPSGGRIRLIQQLGSHLGIRGQGQREAPVGRPGSGQNHPRNAAEFLNSGRCGRPQRPAPQGPAVRAAAGTVGPSRTARNPDGSRLLRDRSGPMCEGEGKQKSRAAGGMANSSPSTRAALAGSRSQ